MVVRGRGRAPENQLQLPKTSNELIREIAELKRKPNSQEALKMLHKIGSLVKPVMKSHGFKVGKLVEFFPKDGRLLGLNVNHGMKICVRLRPHYDESRFYPLEEVLGTMLHELTHNKFGAHDQKFYGFLDKLKAEQMDVMAKGYTGEGFMSEGNRLGKGMSHNVSLTQARLKALNAAQQRSNTSKTSKGSGQKLGGSAVPNRPLAQLIREAAERRAIDNKWCKDAESFTKEELNEADDEVEVISSREVTPKTTTAFEVIDLTED